MTNDAIILDMDESREIRWTFGALNMFEKRGREILRQLKITGDRGQPITNVHAGALLANFGRISEIMEAAIAATTGLSGLDMKEGPSPAASAIDAYLAKGGDLDSLQKAIYQAYLTAADPSGLQEWQTDVAREIEIRAINQQKADAKLEVARLELASDQEKIATLTKLATGGSTPTTSPTSS